MQRNVTARQSEVTQVHTFLGGSYWTVLKIVYLHYPLTLRVWDFTCILGEKTSVN